MRKVFQVTACLCILTSAANAETAHSSASAPAESSSQSVAEEEFAEVSRRLRACASTAYELLQTKILLEARVAALTQQLSEKRK